MNTVIAVLEIATIVLAVSIVTVLATVLTGTQQSARVAVARAGRQVAAFEPWIHDTSLAQARR